MKYSSDCTYKVESFQRLFTYTDLESQISTSLLTANRQPHNQLKEAKVASRQHCFATYKKIFAGYLLNFLDAS